MSGSEILPLLSIILATGVGAKIMGDKYGLPSIIFLLIAGIIFGPSGVGIITQETFGSSLTSIVGFAVAIIVFEGAFNLKIDAVREASSTTFKLVSIGAAIALVGTSAAVHFLLSAPWDISFLIGSLLVATGPTVITPILDVVAVPRRVETAMETEGIVNDVTAAILAVVIFKAVVMSDSEPGGFLVEFIQRISVGFFVGIIGAIILYYLIKLVSRSKNAGQNARLLVLVGAIVTFTVADSVASEAGVASVAVAGMILGNLGVPYEEQIEEFKGDITPVVLSITFIVLAALVNLSTIIELGLSGVLLVFAIVFVVRPTLVFISSYNSKFSFGEKMFMSFVAPRGIIPAAVATLFAVQLQNQGATEYASILVSTVFLVIFVTVFLQGGPARYIAKAFNITPMKHIIVGGGTAGEELAKKLESRDEDITIIEINGERVEELKQRGFSVLHGDGTDSEVLEEAGIENASILVAMTKNDDANLLAAQLADVEFGVKNVMARVNDPDSVDTFEKLGIRTIATPSATATAVDNLIERPAMAEWMDDLKDKGDVQDVKLESDECSGLKVKDIGKKLPKDVIIGLVVTDSGETKIPHAEMELDKGFEITLMGERKSVQEAIEMFR